MAGKVQANNPGCLFMGERGGSVHRMNEENIVTFYLHDKLRQKAMAGQHNFIAKLNEVLTSAGLAVAYDDDSDAARLSAPDAVCI